MSLHVFLQVDDEYMPCPHCAGSGSVRRVEPNVFVENLTGNLAPMADAAGLYEPLWEPEKSGITQAAQLIDPLTKGLALLKADPDRFRQMNAPNGWGTYEGLVRFVSRYLSACRENPTATVMAI